MAERQTKHKSWLKYVKFDKDLWRFFGVTVIVVVIAIFLISHFARVGWSEITFADITDMSIVFGLWILLCIVYGVQIYFMVREAKQAQKADEYKAAHPRKHVSAPNGGGTTTSGASDASRKPVEYDPDHADEPFPGAYDNPDYQAQLDGFDSYDDAVQHNWTPK